MTVEENYEKTCWGTSPNHDPICILPLPHPAHTVKAERVESREASHPLYTHRNGDKCIWLDDQGWFVPLDAGGEGYSCVSPEHDAQKNHYVERFLAETGKTIIIGNENRSVLQDWVLKLPYQQQSVLLSSLRGPDGMAKHHPAKVVIRAYRASVIKAATTGKPLTDDDEGDTFMDIRPLFGIPIVTRSFGRMVEDRTSWNEHVQQYFHNVDQMPHHYHLHMLHSAQIAGCHHSDIYVREAWQKFFLEGVDDMHLRPESMQMMNDRLNDFGTSPNGKNGHTLVKPEPLYHLTWENEGGWVCAGYKPDTISHPTQGADCAACLSVIGITK